ncbi:hypothetical protein LN650_23705 [Klebsiella pneumoniae subsp. pneumoniae]|nr:hypothetical protein [Klebsiella pneumoniae subsp. pneumoniae]
MCGRERQLSSQVKYAIGSAAAHWSNKAAVGRKSDFVGILVLEQYDPLHGGLRCIRRTFAPPG